MSTSETRSQKSFSLKLLLKAFGQSNKKSHTLCWLFLVLHTVAIVHNYMRPLLLKIEKEARKEKVTLTSCFEKLCYHCFGEDRNSQSCSYAGTGVSLHKKENSNNGGWYCAGLGVTDGRKWPCGWRESNTGPVKGSRCSNCWVISPAQELHFIDVLGS